jgi:hypothetical protein
MTKGRSTWILFLSVLLLGGYIWLQEVWLARRPSKEIRRVRLFDLHPDTLLSIQFVHTNGIVVECVKENGIWMTGGSGRGLGRADVALVRQTVAGLNAMGKGTTITAKHLEMRGLDTAEYGFDQPTVEIIAVDNKGWRQWLIGRRTPLGDMVYVKTGSKDEIYTVLDKLLTIVPDRTDALRDRTLFPGKPPGVRRMEIRGPGGFIQLLKDSRSEWQIQQPLAAAADPAAVEELLEKLYRLRIADFEAENVSDFSVYGLQGEAQQISLGGGDGSSRMLVIGDEVRDRPGFVYARRADDTAVFVMGDEVLDLLDIRLDTLRDKRLLGLPVGEITYVSVTHGSEQLELTADPAGRWTVSRPVMWEGDDRAINEWLEWWNGAVITEFNDTNAPAAEAEWSLLFGSAGRGETNRIGILPALNDRSGLRILRDDNPSICQINLPDLPENMLDPLEFKSRQLWELRKEEIQRISVERSGRGRQMIERLEDGSFAPAGTNQTVRVEEAALDDMLSALTFVSARGYVAYNPRDLFIYGLAEPSVILQVGLTGTNQLGRVLLVGQEATEGYYAMLKGHDVVFILEKELIETLSADLITEREPAVLPAE